MSVSFIVIFLKTKHRRIYGVIEVVFAWVAGVIAARQMKPGADWSGQIATMIGAVYIVSRGLENVKEGFKNKKQKA